MKGMLGKLSSLLAARKPALTIEDYETMVRATYNSSAMQEFADFQGMVNPDEYLEAGCFLDLLTSPNPRVLDVGCSYGRHAKPLQLCGASYTGIDLSDVAIELARSLVPLPAEFHVMSASDLKFDDNSFAGFWAYMTLFHVPKSMLHLTLRSLHRVIQKGGIGYLLLPNGEGEGFEGNYYAPDVQSHVSRYSASEISRIAIESGFDIVEQTTEPFSIVEMMLAHRLILKK
jgi:SAM-dependent methyltransferase